MTDLEKILKITRMDCQCESGVHWGAILLVGGLFILGSIWLQKRKHHWQQAESFV